MAKVMKANIFQPNTFYNLFQMIVNRYLPKLIIYDVEQAFDLYEYRNDNNRTRYLAAQKPYIREPGIASIFMDVSREEYYKTLSGLCRYNSVSIPLLIDCIKSRPMFDKGYSALNGAIKEEPKKKEAAEGLVIDSVKFEYMRKLL